MQEYAALGAELRRVASEAADEVGPGVWRNTSRTPRNWWKSWRESMRIPRFAFALMVIAVIALTAGLVLVRAKEKHRWFQFEVRDRDGKRIVVAIFPANPEGNLYDPTEAAMPGSDGTIAFMIRILGQNQGMERLGVRARWVPPRTLDNSWAVLHSLPEREFECVPGKRLAIQVDGYGALQVDCQFHEKLPESVRTGLYPLDDVFRIIPPVVFLRGDHLLSKAEFGGGEYLANRGYFAYHVPKVGWYLVSTKPIDGAVEGQIRGNQIEFKMGDQPYLILAAAPITFGRAKVWVMQYSSILEADKFSAWTSKREDYPDLVFGDLENLVETPEKN